jgi:uncharacterized repeat protein (TIGR04138 family)
MPPPSKPVGPEKTIDQIVSEVGIYPMEAYAFVREGLEHTVNKLHGSTAGKDPASLHVGGRELCEGLRELAITRWGMLSRTVLARWNICRTIDFGRIVFALVENGHLQATDEDSLEDFRDVFDFGRAFESGYRIEKVR